MADHDERADAILNEFLSRGDSDWRDEHRERSEEIIRWAKRSRNSWVWRFVEKRVRPGRHPHPRAQVIAECLEQLFVRSPHAYVIVSANRKLLYIQTMGREGCSKGRGST